MDLSEIFSGAITPAKWRALGDFLATGSIRTGPGMRVRQVGNKTVISAKRRPALLVGNTLPPLWPTLISVGPPETVTYKFTLSLGYVNDRIPGEGDALAAHEIKGIKWEGDAPSGQTADDLREHDIAVGQQITVLVYHDELGEPGGDDAPEDFVAEVIIEDEDPASEHYVPPCGDDQEGTSGKFRYKIAVLKDADLDHAEPWFDYFLAGSHISHFRQLPLVDNYRTEFEEDYGRIIGKYDAEENKYKIRTPKARYGHYITEEDELIQIDFAGENIGGGVEVWKEPETESEDDALPDEPVKFRTFRGLSSDETADEEISQQIFVLLADGEPVDGQPTPDAAILIRGNGTKATLTFKKSAADDVEVIQNDGLITYDQDQTFEVLPDGNQGDMLYHDGDGWVPLAAPTGSGTSVLGHDGTVPMWLETSQCS